MIRYHRMKQTATITTLCLILLLWMAFLGYAEDGKQGVFKCDLIPFRLALSQQNITNIYPLFPITDNRYAVNHKNLSQQMGDKNLSPIFKGQMKRNDRLGNSLFTASLLTLTALNIADYVSTVKALQLPGLEEGNPVMRPFTKNILLFGAVKLGISALDFYLLKNIYKKNKPLGWVLSIVGNFAMSYMVSHNIRKIQAVSGK